MVQLSIIIVNYNVHYFLEQALLAVLKATENINAEIFVVDNNSSDQSVEMVQTKFPEVILITNKKNTGFSVANNQAIEKATGKYILLLNPDTVVQEDTFQKCIAKMENDEKIGGLGVRMIDGKGNFLPESKRAMPTPSVAFYKAFGLASLFPKSKTFGKYHLGYLDEHDNNEVEILAGAFMLMRKDVLDEIGYLDETFFMYGEDIDLSYRIIQAGYKNYYLADATIIHYKGESTKKGSLNYVKVFYNAMIIFAKKHFSAKQAKLYTAAIYLAIFIKGNFTFFQNILKQSFLPFIDALLSFLGVFAIAQFWASKVKIGIENYPKEFLFVVLPIYSLVWVVFTFFVGGCQKPFKVRDVFKSIFFGTLAIAAIYGFLPEELRFSRAIILMGAAYTFVSMLLVRWFYNGFANNSFTFEITEHRKTVIIGNSAESERAYNLLNEVSNEIEFIGTISLKENTADKKQIGILKNLKELVKIYEIETFIFCSKDITYAEIINWIETLGNNFSYKILPENSNSIIGSDSKNTAGDLYALDVNLNLSNIRVQREKRLFDFFSSLFLLLTSLFTFWFTKDKLGFIKNIFSVLKGNKTWVGYYNSEEEKYNLPKLNEGVLFPTKEMDAIKKGLNAKRLNLLYAKNYSVYLDMQYIRNNFKFLGN